MVMPQRERQFTTEQKINKTIKKINRALKQTDSFLTFYKLKRIKISCDICLNEKIITKIYHFIKMFKSHNILFENDFDKFMSNFLLNIRSDNLEIHLVCLANLENVDIDLSREKFGYSKIFNYFKHKIRNIFTDKTDQNTLSFLIKLLDNSKLIFKQLGPVLERLNIFLEKSIIDKSIVECCVVISSLKMGCAEVLNDEFVFSLLSFLVDFLAKPQTFFFIDLESSQIITETINILVETLMKYDKLSINIKKLSNNLLQNCVNKIKELKNSTVYEEVMTVVCMTYCLTPILKLSKSKGNSSFKSIITDDLLSFVVFEKHQKKTPKESNSIEKFHINFERPFKSQHNIINQSVRDLFFKNKYIFVDNFSNLNRIEFLNDLAKIDNPNLIFSVLKNTKPQLDWSDLIVFACNAPVKDCYISLIFDNIFIEKEEHSVFLDIFLKNIIDNPINLVYFTKCAIKSETIYLLPKLYLIDLDKNTEISKKRRVMIIEYLNGLGDNIRYGPLNDEEIKVKRLKEVEVNIEKITLEDASIEKHKKVSVNEIIPIDSKIQIKKEIEFEVEGIESNFIIQNFISILSEEISELHYNLIPLLIVLASKKIEKENLENLLKKLIKCLKNKSISIKDNEAISMITTISILCKIYKNEFYKDTPIDSIIDILVGLIQIKTTKLSDQYVSKIKEHGFDIILSEPQWVGLISEIFQQDKNSIYILEYSKIMWLITGKSYLKKKDRSLFSKSKTKGLE